MILSSPSAVAFDVFGFAVYWYGIILAFAILLGTIWADFIYRRYFLCFDSSSLILDIAPWLIFVGFCGARIYYCLINFTYYSEHLLEIFNVRQGGLSIHGAILFCVIFLFFYSKLKKVSFFDLGASLSVGLVFAQSVGRWGNFFNSEAFGKPYDGFLKLYVSPEHRPEIYSNVEYYHPTFLYESVLNLCIFVILFFVVKSKKISSMFVVGLYLGLYSIVRIVVESIRVDSVLSVLGLPIATVVSVLEVFVSIILILLALKFKFR